MKLLATLFFFILLQSSFATTYYISPKGSDETGNGSTNNPWKTLYKATVAVTIPGDIIHVNAGSYTEIRQCILAVGISIEGEDTNSIIKSTLADDYTEMLSLKSVEGTNGNQHISNLKFDGQNLSTFWGIYVAGRSNVSMHDITVVDFKDMGVIFTGRGDNVEAPPLIYATGNTFYHNTISNCARYTDNWGRGCLNIGGQLGMLIYDNTIEQTGRPKGTNGWPIKYASGGYLKGVKIYNNTITKEAFDGITWDFAIELFNEWGLEIYNNNIIGAVDLNHQNRGDYLYGAYIHDNIIGPQKAQPELEDGVILEFESNDVIIENNQLKNLGVIVYFTPRPASTISNITIKGNRCNNIGVAGGRHLGFAIRMGEEETDLYFLENLFVYNNEFIASPTEKPYWGIGVLGVAKANNILIKNNIIKNFSAGCIVANPGSTIDTMVVEGNTLSENGYGNRPVFSKGEPNHFSTANNTRTNGNFFTFANLKMNIIRPFYYELKATNLIVFIAMFTGILSLWFARKENIYLYPTVLINIIVFIFLSLDQGLNLVAGLNFYFIAMGIYGWVLWNKRDKKKRRIFHINPSSGKEKIIQSALFIVSLSGILLLHSLFGKEFTDNKVWVNAFAMAAAFTGAWLMARKKLESWYWLITTFLTLSYIYFSEHNISNTIYFCLLLIMSFQGLFKWKKRISTRIHINKKNNY